MKTYIVIDQGDVQVAWPTNTPEQVAEARRAIRQAGLKYARVYRGLTDEVGRGEELGYALPAADGTGGYVERVPCDPDHSGIKAERTLFEAATREGYVQDGIRFRHCRRCNSTLSHPEDAQA